MGSTTDKYSLQCDKAPVQAVLTALFQKAHVHFLLDQPMTGTVTVDLEDMSFSTVLHAVCNAATPALTCPLLGDIYHVSTAPERVYFHLKPYAAPLDIAPQTRVQPSRASAADIQWGYRQPWGLQLGLWKPADTSMLLCVIRNDGSEPANYDDYFLGYWEDLKVWARPHGTLFWTQVPVYSKSRISMGGTPSDADYHTLAPGRSVPWGLKEPPPTPVSPSRESTFGLYLGPYLWPASQSGLDIMVSQAKVDQTSEGTLTSGVITLPLEPVSTDWWDQTPEPIHMFRTWGQGFASSSIESKERDKGDTTSADLPQAGRPDLLLAPLGDGPLPTHGSAATVCARRQPFPLCHRKASSER